MLLEVPCVFDDVFGVVDVFDLFLEFASPLRHNTPLFFALLSFLFLLHLGVFLFFFFPVN